jgi:hypothetical protein
MSRRRQIVVALVLGTLGIVGLAVAAMGAKPGAMTDAQYQQLVDKLDKNNPEALFAHAKMCYQNDLKDEAMKYALLANEKAPDDTRPKYLIFALIGVTDTGGDGKDGGDIEDAGGGSKPPTISDAEVAALVKVEGEPAIRKFKEVQGLLARRCGSAKCHSGGNPKAKWSLALKGTANLNMLAENFRTIYPYLNRENPAESRLLMMPTKGPEAGHPQQILRGEADPLFKKAVAWIDTVKTDAEKMWEKK